jgi:hypothetical protein
MRKAIGSIALVAWMLGYVAVAAVVGDRIASEHWAWKLLYFPIVGCPGSAAEAPAPLDARQGRPPRKPGRLIETPSWLSA